MHHHLVRGPFSYPFKKETFFVQIQNLDFSFGNSFAQFIHDGATLANKNKYQTGGLQIIEPAWKQSLCLYIGVVKSESGKDKDVAELFQGLIKETTGYEMKNICNSCVRCCCSRSRNQLGS